jgi:Ser/Thr protein kinase RdoA (MazF antagonist)
MTTAHELLDLCRQHLDPHAEPTTHHTSHEHPTVLRATTRHGEIFIKIHHDRERHTRERNAYRHWAPALAEQAPRLLAEINDPPALIITALPGTPLAHLTLPPHTERDVYRQAGAILATWHTAQPPRDTPTMTTWLADRGEQWLQLATPILPATRRAEIHAHLRELATLGPLPAVPCHLDFTPRNLLRTPDGTVSIIDFEHARYDLAARDLVRLASRIWHHRPDLEHAFLTTYGPLTDLDRQIIKHCTHLDNLTAAVRSTGRNLPTITPTPKGH